MTWCNSLVSMRWTIGVSGFTYTVHIIVLRSIKSINVKSLCIYVELYFSQHMACRILQVVGINVSVSEMWLEAVVAAATRLVFLQLLLIFLFSTRRQLMINLNFQNCWNFIFKVLLIQLTIYNLYIPCVCRFFLTGTFQVWFHAITYRVGVNTQPFDTWLVSCWRV